jgi:hypothetical protein
LTKRILVLLEDDPQPVVKEASALKPSTAQNNTQVRRRIRMHSLIPEIFDEY